MLMCGNASINILLHLQVTLYIDKNCRLITDFEILTESTLFGAVIRTIFILGSFIGKLFIKLIGEFFFLTYKQALTVDKSRLRKMSN